MRWIVTAVLMAVPALAWAAPDGPILQWEVDGLATPESALFDARRQVIYVSNIDGNPMEQDGRGGIARVSPEGRLLERSWVGGLDAPKGLALHAGRLYVADVGALVAIDVARARVIKRYPAPASRFLNDVTVDSRGRVYVSDMRGAAIYRLEDGVFEPWLVSDKRRLCSPNGLYAAPRFLVVGCWTVVVDEFETVEPGRLKTVDYGDRSIHSLGEDLPLGHIDGVEPDGAGGYYLTDWLAGTVLHRDANGRARTVLDLEQGPADHDFVPERKLLLVPMMNHHVLRAYRVR